MLMKYTFEELKTVCLAKHVSSIENSLFRIQYRECQYRQDHLCPLSECFLMRHMRTKNHEHVSDLYN